ncbi:MAG: DUF916 domain-containing protein [Streptococcaceae bacterium]|nr:DUF916 domain-containing protein [Streptococcaceae bacterium]
MFLTIKNKKICLFLAIIAIFLAINTLFTKDIKADEVGFSASIIQEKHQTNKKLTYWSLNLDGDKEIKLKLHISNADKENTFEITSNQAITNKNLVIDYGLDKKTTEKALNKKPSFDFYSDVLLGKNKEKGKTVLTLKPNQSIDFPIIVKVPNGKIKDMQIGGINITRQPTPEEKQKSIVNVYNYAFALVLEGEKKENDPKFEIELGKLTAKSQKIFLENPTPAVAIDTSIMAIIKDEDGKEYSKVTLKNGTLVPNAKVEIELLSSTILRNNQEYLLEVTTKEEKKQTKETFKLFVDNVGKITAKKENNRIFLTVGLSLFLLLIVTFILVHKKMKKQKK